MTIIKTNKRISPLMESRIGKVFGRLTIIEIAGRDSRNRYLVKVRCACGTEKIVRYDHLARKNGTKSCGCYKSEFLVHGEFNSKKEKE